MCLLIGIIVVSFLQWDLISPAHLAGLTTTAMSCTTPNSAKPSPTRFLFDILTTAIHLVLGMGLALAVTSVRSRAVRYWARTAIVTPFLMSAGVVALMWSYILAGRYRAVQLLLEEDRFEPAKLARLEYLGDTRARDYRRVGHTRLYLHYIPRRASDDPDGYVRGGGHRRSVRGSGKFRYITLPMLSPATFIASLTAFIGAFEIFTWPLIDTNGGPGIATQTIVLYIYRSAFQNYQFGYSAVVSLINIAILISFAVAMALLAQDAGSIMSGSRGAVMSGSRAVVR